MDYKLLNENDYLELLKQNIKIKSEASKAQKIIHEADDVEDIEVENPGILEVPEGKDVNDLGEDHFKSLIKKKGWEEISRALVNLDRWNKNRDPKLSSWADNMQQKLSDWVDKQREEKGDQDLYA